MGPPRERKCAGERGEREREMKNFVSERGESKRKMQRELWGHA
jgi:hypothetical protein